MALAAAAAAAVLAIVGTTVALRGSSSDDVGDLLAAPDAVVTSLEGSSGSLQVVWSPEQRRVAIVGNGLAPPGEEMTYALWFLVDDGAAPATLFQPDADGVVRIVASVDETDPAGWGVTIEPAGGSPQPTGDVLYAGTI